MDKLIEDKVYIINRCDYLVSDFFEETINGCTVIDDYILKYNHQEYYIVRCEVIGIEIQRDLEVYRLES